MILVFGVQKRKELPEGLLDIASRRWSLHPKTTNKLY